MAAPIKHGQSTRRRRTPLYRRWEGMIQRTTNPKNPDFKHYGGRGITVCDEWRAFVPFYEWAVKNCFSEELELDRRDGNGNYCPENCRWVDSLTNKRNVPSRHRNKPYNWGVSKTPNEKYAVQVRRNGGLHHVGRFLTEQLAIEARDKFIRQ